MLNWLGICIATHQLEDVDAFKLYTVLYCVWNSSSSEVEKKRSSDMHERIYSSYPEYVRCSLACGIFFTLLASKVKLKERELSTIEVCEQLSSEAPLLPKLTLQIPLEFCFFSYPKVFCREERRQGKPRKTFVEDGQLWAHPENTRK